MLYLKNMTSVQVCVCVSKHHLSSFPLSSSSSSMVFFFLVAPLFDTITSLQEAGWDESQLGGMCYHSNKLTHWQDSTIFLRATGAQQQMQSPMCDSSKCLLILGGWRHPYFGQISAASSELGWLMMEKWEEGERISRAA